MNGKPILNQHKAFCLKTSGSNRHVHQSTLRLKVLRQRHIYPIRPAKSILQWVFTTAAHTGIAGDIIFFNQLFIARINCFRRVHPARFYLISQLIKTIVSQCNNRRPVEWRPAIWRVPLLAVINRCCHNATVFEQVLLQTLPCGAGCAVCQCTCLSVGLVYYGNCLRFLHRIAGGLPLL